MLVTVIDTVGGGADPAVAPEIAAPAQGQGPGQDRRLVLDHAVRSLVPVPVRDQGKDPGHVTDHELPTVPSQDLDPDLVPRHEAGHLVDHLKEIMVHQVSRMGMQKMMIRNKFFLASNHVYH